MHQVLNANGTPGEKEQNIIEFKASNNTYICTTRKWELKSQGTVPQVLSIVVCPTLTVTSLQFTPTPAIVLPVYSRMTATKPLELVAYTLLWT